MQTALEIKDVWKSYNRNQERKYLSLRDMLTGIRKNKRHTPDWFWALQEIDLTLEQGTTLGIIGKNGAGKSTLLKILSRITLPTRGEITIRGRVASLLEVGTGFHPELTGRENIYFNGSMLGMKFHEIKQKFDEIVDFSGVASFIDTPLKHFSSGMQMRLAFGVAAHLETEIMLIDEVLAVGDAAFQKKCIQKIESVQKTDGKTIVMVSHDMLTLAPLCSRGLYLDQGKPAYIGGIEEAIQTYMEDLKLPVEHVLQSEQRKGNKNIVFTHFSLDRTIIYPHEKLHFNVKYDASKLKEGSHLMVNIVIFNSMQRRVAWMSSDKAKGQLHFKRGELTFEIDGLPLVPGEYMCNLYAEVDYEIADWLWAVLPFSISHPLQDPDYLNVPKGQGDVMLTYCIVH